MARDGEPPARRPADGIRASGGPGSAWHGSPDDLWPPFGRTYGPPGQQPRPDRRGQQRHDRPQEFGRRGADRTRPRLTRDEIVDAAIAIADSEGADAISMRKIAQVLRSGTMSLYWHVASKEHLLDLMLDTLAAEGEIPRPSGDWRADLRAMAVSARASLSRHRWVMEFVGGRPPLGPNTLLRLEGMLGVLDDLDLDLDTAMNILTTVNTYVGGVVLRETQEIRTQQAEDRVGLDASELARDMASWRAKLAATGQFGHFIKFLDSDIDPDAAETRNERFEFGLDCLLDGIAARIAGIGAARPTRPGSRPEPE